MTNATHVAIVVCSLDDHIIGWSDGAARLSGYAAEEVLGGALHVLCPRPQASKSQGDERLIDKRGRSIAGRWIRTPIHAEHGELVAFTDLFVPARADASARGAGVERARPSHHAERREELRTLLAGTSYGCLLLDEHGRIAAVSESARRMLGYPEGELLAKPARLLLPPLLPGRADLDTMAEEPRARRKDGSTFAVQLGLGSFEADDARFVVAMVRDLSARLSPVDALRESPHRFRQVIDALPLLVWACLPDGQCVFVSGRCVEYAGSAEQFYGWSWSELVHPEDRERALTEWRSTIAQRTSSLTEMRLRRRDGAYRWFEGRAIAVYDDDGRILCWLGCHADVHEARLGREALAREREHLARIIAAAPGAFYSYRRAPDGTIAMTHTSPLLQHILGETADQIEADVNALAFIHPDDRQRVRELIEEGSRAIRPIHSVHRMLTPTMGERWVETTNTPRVEEDGAVHWFGFLQDITPHRAALESLATAQAHLLAALEAGGMGILEWDIPHDRLALDDGSLKLFGCARELLSGPAEGLLACVHGEDAAAVREAFSSLARGTPEASLEYRVTLPDGELRWLAARAHAERDAAGRPLRATLLHVDITEQKRSAERQLRSQKLEALGTLAGGIAHDFNNMLQAIAGNTMLALHMLGAGHPAVPMLEAIELAGARAADLVRRILQFSRPSEQHRKVLSLRAIVSEALKLVRATLPSLIEIREELGEASPLVEADATQIHQLILNLATNAGHAIGPASGYLRVQLETVDVRDGSARALAELPRGRYAVLHVSDSGCGMTGETLQRVFDPFFTTKPVGEGTGLGLSVVHGIMKTLGGAISVRSELGLGATFSLFFPLTEQLEETRVELPPQPVDRPGGRVLFVDDEPLLVALGTRTLEFLGYEGIGFARPREALRAFLDEPGAFDAVVTDFAMPDLSGCDLAARIREVRPELPILLVSGNVGPDELVQAERLGIADVLLKPVDLDVLGSALARALRLKRTA